jgi:UDP-N-acetylglucosamine diphosphorylase/glucosamine-1-phosphate N-acetyltransferase
MSLVLLDDAVARRFEPFALTRPVSELRAGAELLRRRWERALGQPASSSVAGEHLADFEEPGAVPTRRLELASGTILANSRCAVSLRAVQRDTNLWRCQGRVAAVRLTEALPAARLAQVTSLDELAPAGARAANVDGWWLDAVWDLVRFLPEMLTADIALLAPAARASPAPHARLGEYDVCVEETATVDPLVMLDATAGPILVRRGARVHSFTRLVGPCVIGENTVVNGGKIAACSIGDDCRVHGELSTTIFTGHSNKSHEGFIGHSVLGRWVNLGASTVNSNLKNTYGTVALWTPEGMKDTGMQFLGTMFGDHVKTAIATRLTTGCVVGAGANVFGNQTTPKVVPPFAWGLDGDDVVALNRFLVSAERMMARRHVPLGERAKRQLAAAWEARWRTES